MRIRIWNAFASNNSGSYTIVGSFSDRAVAAEVAAELAELARAHTAWLAAEMAKNQPIAGVSPLEEFVKARGLTWLDRMGTDDDWPEHNHDNVPQVFAIDSKVVLHHDYTVTMPKVFGEYFYQRGGRVDHELNHAHHPIVGVFELGVPWQERKTIDVPAKVQAIVEALHADDGPLVTEVPIGHRPAWMTKEGFGEADLTVGAVFEDLARGFTAVAKIAAAHGLRTHVKIFEAWGSGDPLGFLRPCTPALASRLCRVVLEAPGEQPKQVTQQLAALVFYDYAAAGKLLAAAPVTVMSGLVPARAEKLAALLREAGASARVETEPRVL